MSEHCSLPQEISVNVRNCKAFHSDTYIFTSFCVHMGNITVLFVALSFSFDEVFENTQWNSIFAQKQQQQQNWPFRLMPMPLYISILTAVTFNVQITDFIDGHLFFGGGVYNFIILRHFVNLHHFPWKISWIRFASLKIVPRRQAQFAMRYNKTREYQWYINIIVNFIIVIIFGEKKKNWKETFSAFSAFSSRLSALMKTRISDKSCKYKTEFAISRIFLEMRCEWFCCYNGPQSKMKLWQMESLPVNSRSMKMSNFT